MCGICGYVGADDRHLVASMMAVQAHRGPDGCGIQTFRPGGGRPAAALGHRRLSIIDPTDRGAQPMSYASGRYWITYNGELYNFPELRDSLEKRGFTFRTECDTEVLLAMYAAHGEAMLERLNGIFAFAIWDSGRGELFLARDKLGVKPLYHAEHDGKFFFASEIKALLPALPSRAMNRQAVADFLTFLWVPDPETMFDGVFKLAPGHCGVYRDGKLRTRQYWDLRFEVAEGRSDAHLAEEVRATVQTAVRRQMISDVPLGVFFSGGLDSTAISATMQAGRSEPVTSYTAGFGKDDIAYETVPDDLRYARRVGEQIGLDCRERILRPDIVDLLPRLVWHMDEPVADPAGITTYLLCSAASEQLTVILSGMGGDEVYAGYPRYLAARLGRAADVIPRFARQAMRQAADRRLTLGPPGRMRGPRRNLMKFLHGIDQTHIERYLTYCSYYKGDELATVLGPDLRGALNGYDPFWRHRDYLGRVREEAWLNQLIYLDIKTFLPCLNLTYTDKMGMAASTEVRVPLLDDEVVEHAATIPPEMKLRRLTRKFVFKKSMDGVLPGEAIWRPKAGFGAPIRSWLVGELRPMVDELLAPEAVAARGLVDPAAVRTLIEDNASGAADNALRIWALLVLEIWQRTFLDRTPAAPLDSQVAISAH